MQSRRDVCEVMQSRRDGYEVTQSRRDVCAVMQSQRDVCEVMQSRRDVCDVMLNDCRQSRPLQLKIPTFLKLLCGSVSIVMYSSGSRPLKTVTIVAVLWPLYRKEKTKQNMAKEKRMIRNIRQIRENILLSLGRKSDVPWSERFENDILWLARVESDVFWLMPWEWRLLVGTAWKWRLVVLTSRNWRFWLAGQDSYVNCLSCHVRLPPCILYWRSFFALSPCYERHLSFPDNTFGVFYSRGRWWEEEVGGRQTSRLLIHINRYWSSLASDHTHHFNQISPRRPLVTRMSGDEEAESERAKIQAVQSWTAVSSLLLFSAFFFFFFFPPFSLWLWPRFCWRTECRVLNCC